MSYLNSSEKVVSVELFINIKYLYESILLNIAAVTKDLEAVYQTDIRRS